MRTAHWLYTIPLRLRSLFRRRDADRELDDELRDHLERKTEEYVAKGLPLKEARRQALIDLGGVEQVKEKCRDTRHVNSIQDLTHDLRYGLRMLRKSPSFTVVAVLTLALGIGANTSLFSVVNGVLLNPLPYPHPDQVVIASNTSSTLPETWISYPDFLDWVRDNHSFSSLSAYESLVSFNLLGQGEPERVSATEISSAFFPALGVTPVLGRNLSPAEDQLNGPPAVILSGGFWKTKFGSSPDILGKSINLDGTDYTVVGVLPENFYFCCENISFRLSDVYVPIGADKNPWMRDRKFHPGIYAIGRLKPGVTLAQARADMDGMASSLAAAYPDTDKDQGIRVTPLKQVVVREIRPFLLVLLTAVGFVLLIACVNVANLLLARSTGRVREFAIRAALGASQGRVIRQLLTESVLLAMAGGALGLLLASWGTRTALSVLPSTLPRASDVRMDPHVLLFTLVVSLLAGVLVGLAPALKISQPDLHETLKEGGRGASGAHYRTQSVFVVIEMALTVVLLVGAGLTIRTLVSLSSVNPGFDPHHVLSFNVGFPPSVASADATQIRAGFRQLTDKIAAVPGVQSVSLMNAAVPMGDRYDVNFWINGQPKPATDANKPLTLWYLVGPDYLKVMKIPLLRGRFLTAQDDANSPGVCVIDEDFARKYFGNQDPIGKRLNFDLVYKQLEIVGVVGHVKQFGLDENARSLARAQLYASALQLPDNLTQAWVPFTGYVIRTQGSPDAFAASIRGALRRFNSKAVMFHTETMDSVVARSLASRRFAMILLAVFAALALVLASIGIYGVISYVAGQRTREIGIRLALGATRSDILKMVLVDGTRLAVTGVAAGLVVVAGLTRLMAKILYGVSATDPLTFTVVAVILTLVALAACYVPARRAMRVDPMVALRHE
ncbi:MAG TPA: ABC transporter permease [Candidatus Acidoferrales bacterium]|nr:ABC transporter permease [Candidatus Acidoferrales bacterium]HEV3481432.1 ABC transporter permease [Candidatus Acidoferrales bacterium]